MWKEFIRKRGARQVSEELGVSHQTVYNWLKNIGNVSDDAKRKLVKLSDGELSLMDFFRVSNNNNV